MRDLFMIDTKDYNPDGPVISRPSVRGIIVRDGKVLLIYSKKYDYYKFPGGGIESGESHEEALIREVREESGYHVIPGTVTEFGRVLRRQNDGLNDGGIFEQENLYYFCEAEAEPGETKLDDYEAEEGFTAVWMNPFEASGHNRYCRGKGDGIMVKREMRVLDMVDLELRRRERKRHEEESIKALGSSDYAGMLDFVEEQLETKSTEDMEFKTEIAYSRFEHTKRVLAWTKRLYDLAPDKAELRYEDLIIAAIFHDVGRNLAYEMHISHAEAGVPITRKYLLEHGFDEERTEFICMLVGKHSDKYRMNEPGLDRNLLLIMEADLLDDMGAQGVVMDCMITERRNPKATFTDCFDHISRYTLRIQQDNPMTTAEGKKLWDEKTRLVEEFVAALKKDLEF